MHFNRGISHFRLLSHYSRCTCLNARHTVDTLQLPTFLCFFLINLKWLPATNFLNQLPGRSSQILGNMPNQPLWEQSFEEAFK